MKDIIQLQDMMELLVNPGIRLAAAIVVQEYLELWSVHITKKESHLLDGYCARTVEMVPFLLKMATSIPVFLLALILKDYQSMC